MRPLPYAACTVIALCGLVFLAFLFVAPRFNWSAAFKPGPLETRIADWIRERWVAIHVTEQNNPVRSTPEALASGRHEYNEYCAVCHGLDGSGRNRLHANFYPSVARLTGDTQQMSDAEIYFVVSNGIALSGMPSFTSHGREEIWKLVLWLRHLPNLSAAERNEIEPQTSDQPQ